MSNPYKIEGPALISFSGGRTSGYMLWHVLDAYDGRLPDDVYVCFANTGKEREETLRFVHECATRWGVSIKWLEASDRGNSDLGERFEEVGFNSASRDGAPFKKLIDRKQYLPCGVMRFCTTELKINPMKFFMQSLGYKKWTNVVGLRADERHRVERGMAANDKGKDPWFSVFPMYESGVSQRDVMSWWDKQPFNLNLLPFEGNCDACFLKGRGKLMEIERTAPGTLNWWADMETYATSINAKQSLRNFNKEYSYQDIIQAVKRQGDLFAGYFDDDPEMDAECGLWCDGGAP